MENVVSFPSPIERVVRLIKKNQPELAAYDETREERVQALIRTDLTTLRWMWDNVGDNSFCGEHDCADIHAALVAKGDGAYCAV